MFVYGINSNLEGVFLDASKHVKGVALKGGKVHFDDTWTQARAEKFLEYADPNRKATFEIPKKQFTPDTDDRAILNGMGIEEDEFDNLAFFDIKAANTLLDRDQERFTASFLRELARQANEEKSSIIFMHDPSKGFFGRTIKAHVEEDVNGVHWLMLKVFVPRTGATLPGSGQEVFQALKQKLLHHVSIGFMARPKIEELANGDFIGIFDYTGTEKVQFIETSFVHLGAQRGARVKSYKFEGNGNATGAEQPQKRKYKMEKSLKFGSDSVTLTATEAGITGLETVQAKINSLTNERDNYKSQAEAAEAQIKSLKDPAIARINELYDSLKYAPHAKIDDLEAKSLSRLTEIRDGLEAEWVDANHEKQTGNGGQDPAENFKSAQAVSTFKP